MILPTHGTDQRSTDGRTGQHRETLDGEDHPHPHPRFPQIRGEAGQAGREERLDTAGHDAIKDRPDIDPSDTRGRYPRQHADTATQCDGDEHRQGSNSVRDVVQSDPTDGPRPVQDQEKVQTVREGHADDVATVRGDVVKREV